MKKLTSLLLAIGVFCAAAMTASAQAPLQYRVDDVADLLAITLYGSDAKVVAWVGGNTTRDDGLGGMFYYDGQSSAATNVYAVFKPTNNNGRWFKLPTSVAWQNAAVTVGDETTYGWKFLRGTGQTNFMSFGADNTRAYIQTWASKNLHINNQGNHTVLNETAGNVGIGDAAPEAKLAVNGGVHVGGSSNPGDNNLAVDGTALVTGAITNSALTASLPVFTDASKVLVSQSVAASKTALGIQAGTVVTTADNTVTNTFATAFSVAPVVVTTPTGAAGTTCLTNAVISVSTTGFVYNCGVPSVTIQWVAIGAP